MLRRRRAGALILAAFLLAVGALGAYLLTAGRDALLSSALSSRVLLAGTTACVLAALAWAAVIVRTYLLARPRGLDAGRQAVGLAVVAALCLVVAAPLGFAANLANSQRQLLNTLFAGGGTAAAEAINKPRLNILLIGSDAGPTREGARTDTMMVASIDTRTARTTLFALPRNLGHAPFPPGSPMAEEFPDGFHDPDSPLSGEYLLNAVYPYGNRHPRVAPNGPTRDPGMNLLHQTISYMLGIELDYYIQVNMAGFASIVDALGGLTVDVGPQRIPIGGILPSGERVEPRYYIDPGVQHLSGEQTLAFARSRTGTTDYDRMGRQRCLLQSILEQKSPAVLLTNFQQIAAAATNNVSTNIPQQVLPALVSLATEKGLTLSSVAFDPDLPDPEEPDGQFDTLSPNFPLMRQVVQDTLHPAPAPAASSNTAAPSTASHGGDSAGNRAADSDDDSDRDSAARTPAPDPAPTPLARSCA